jgi:hypothetical protein
MLGTLIIAQPKLIGQKLLGIRGQHLIFALSDKSFSVDLTIAQTQIVLKEISLLWTVLCCSN